MKQGKPMSRDKKTRVGSCAIRLGVLGKELSGPLGTKHCFCPSFVHVGSFYHAYCEKQRL